jgi:hypothetical protein
MKKILLNFLLILGVVSCSFNNERLPLSNVSFTPTPLIPVAPQTEATIPFDSSEPPLVTKVFLPSSELIQNPERGFSTELDLEDSDYFQYYEDGTTLVYATIRLDEYVANELPQVFLSDLDEWFSLIRAGGVKVILRFSYNDGPYPFPEPDADLEQILFHIQQLTPVIRKNADVIVWLEAGFIGAWGEWHTSTNGLDDDIEAKRQVLFSLLDAVPSDRMVLLRYPVDIIQNFPVPLSAQNAFNGTYQARVGFHNDCFLASDDDENTYARDGINSYEEEVEYLALSTRFVPVGGESCAYNPPRSDCPTALRELAFFHFDEIGDGWYPEVLNSWTEQGCYDEVESKLGYRFSLISTVVNEIVLPGGILNLKVELNNSGFSNLKNPRPLYLILDGAERYQTLLPVDPRFWAPDTVSSFNFRLRIPADAPLGEYKLALWMPDAYVSLQNNPKYSVRFANDGVWEQQNGYNLVGNIEVNLLASGNVDESADQFVVLP